MWASLQYLFLAAKVSWSVIMVHSGLGCLLGRFLCSWKWALCQSWISKNVQNLPWWKFARTFFPNSARMKECLCVSPFLGCWWIYARAIGSRWGSALGPRWSLISISSYYRMFGLDFSAGALEQLTLVGAWGLGLPRLSAVLQPILMCGSSYILPPPVHTKFRGDEGMLEPAVLTNPSSPSMPCTVYVIFVPFIL